MASLIVQETTGNKQVLELPEGINLNLMELLKAYEYPVLGTCDGMAICGTCHIKILNGIDQLEPANDMEMDMLDSLPTSCGKSRLACQIKMPLAVENLAIEVLGD